jgi:hypothetical protein
MICPYCQTEGGKMGMLGHLRMAHGKSIREAMDIVKKLEMKG